MLVNTKPTSDDWENRALQASNASLLGALIVHVYAGTYYICKCFAIISRAPSYVAVLSFLGAFLLIRYKLKEATREEMIAEGIKLVNSPLRGSIFQDVERGPADQEPQQTVTNNDAQSTTQKPANTEAAAPERNKRKGSYPVEPPIMSTHPHIEQVGPFMSSVSSHLLSRTHTLCVFLAAVGFILAIVGILCYAWASQPRAVSIFASTCLGGAVLAMVILLF